MDGIGLRGGHSKGHDRAIDFREARDHPAIPGRLIKSDGDSSVVALVTGVRVSVATDDGRFLRALQRNDLCRSQGEPVVLVNGHYGFIGLAIGPGKPPRRLAVRYGAVRLENGSAAEILGEAPQPSWLLFRCAVSSMRKRRALV